MKNGGKKKSVAFIFFFSVCMHVCTKSFLKTTTNSSCVCAHLANKADSVSDSDKGNTNI